MSYKHLILDPKEYADLIKWKAEQEKHFAEKLSNRGFWYSISESKYIN